MRYEMAAISRILRLSVFLLAAGGILKLTKDATDSSRKSNLELVLVQIAFRHGARTPIFPAPCKELEPVTWDVDILMGALPQTDIEYELRNLSGGPKPFSKCDERQKRKILKDQGYSVRVLYKGEEKILPGCSSPLCPLDKFKELVSEYFVGSWEEKCQVLKEN